MRINAFQVFAAIFSEAKWVGMAANKCIMWRNDCRLFVPSKLERGTRKEYPDCFGRTPKPLVAGAMDGGMTSARVGVRRNNYSLPMTQPDARIRSHARPSPRNARPSPSHDHSSSRHANPLPRNAIPIAERFPFISK